MQDDGKDASKTRAKSNKWSLCGVALFLPGISADIVDNVLVDDFSFQVNHTTKKTPISFFEMAVLFFTVPRSVVY